MWGCAGVRECVGVMENAGMCRWERVCGVWVRVHGCDGVRAYKTNVTLSLTDGELVPLSQHEVGR